MRKICRADAGDIGTWIPNLSRIDGALRAAKVPRRAEGDEACLTHYDEGLIPSEKARAAEPEQDAA